MIDVFRAVVEILCIDKDTDTLFRMFDDAHENRLECKVKNQNDDANMNNFIKTTLSQECTLVQCLEQKELPLKPKCLDDSTIRTLVCALKVLEMLATGSDESQKPATRMLIFSIFI